MDQTLIKLFEDSGFTEKEARVYLALLELGMGDVAEIAQKAELKRSIIYVLLEGLMKRGFVSRLPDLKVNVYQPMDPTVILNQLKNTTRNFSDMLPIMRTLGNKGSKKPKISFLETLDGIWNAYEEMSHEQNAFFITSYVQIDKYFPGGINKWIKNHIGKKNTPSARHLIPDSPAESDFGKKFIELGQEVRMLGDLNDMNMDFSLYNETLTITSLEDNPFILIIRSQALVDSMKPIFEIAWAKGKKLDGELDNPPAGKSIFA